ncbi:hypothetical protein CI109_101375 [Kwoniella shandongensis]|uniref:Uncharacterized protein n=1 Tax=Kwoniella shandongensis TaxID=1734106 RepID=A0A5M6BW48_9TREE|nr:uncharacterized protein CI109_005073 [Kwoniella shandongensis]KAA5526501.1 hypothetical protein CI109_005073 [Kwoniella shandongensis]
MSQPEPDQQRSNGEENQPPKPDNDDGDNQPSRSEDQSQQQQQSQPQPQTQTQQSNGGGGGGEGGLPVDVNGITKPVEGLGKTASGALSGLTGNSGGGGGGGQKNEDQALQPLQSRRKPLPNELADTPPSEQPGGGKSKDEQGSLRINIALDLDVEVHLTARVKGEITIGLL